MQRQESKERAVRKSYSIPEDIAEMFEIEARRRDMHPSTLLAQIMKKWLAFDSPMEKIGTVTMPEPCFQAIISSIDAHNLQEVAEEQSNKNFGLILSLLDGQYNLDSLIESYYHKFGKYSGWYSFKHRIIDSGDDIHQLTLQHKMGIKWSRYLANYNHTILEKVCGKVDCRIDDKVVEFEVMSRRRATIDK